ncbi:MAG: hypothetical protein ACNA8P_11530 [Phycisphaerales bacterium]
MNKKTLKSSVLCLAAGLPLSFAMVAQGAPLKIADVAPRSSVIVLGVDDFTALKGSFEQSGFMRIWNDAGIQNWIGSAVKEAVEGLNDELAALGFSVDDLSMPTGPFGWAVYVDNIGDNIDDATYQILGVSDFGDNAEQMSDVIMKTLEEGVDNGNIDLDEEEYRGVTIWTITEVEEDDDLMWGSPGPDLFKQTYMARVDSQIMYATQLSALERAIDRSKGDELQSIASNAEFNAARSAVGQHQGYLVALTGPWFQLTELAQNKMAVEAAEFGEPAPPIMRMIGAAGVDQFKSFSVGLNAENPGSVIEQTISVRFPERRGLLTLIPEGSSNFTAPAFVDADVSSLTMLQVDFAKLFPAVRQIINALPPEMAGMANMGMMQAQMMAGPLLENLGPQIYQIQTIAKPYSVDSMTQYTAIRTRDEAAVSQVIMMLTQQFGLPSRQFEGSQIWDIDLGGMMPMPGGAGGFSIGLGQGHMFIGQTTSIEGALRTAANPNAPRLADEERFKNAVSQMSAQGLSFGWTDTRELVQYGEWMARNSEQVYRAQLEQVFGDDPEFREFIDEDVREYRENMPDYLKNIPNLAVVYENLGDIISDTQNTRDGILMRIRVLKP